MPLAPVAVVSAALLIAGALAVGAVDSVSGSPVVAPSPSPPVPVTVSVRSSPKAPRPRTGYRWPLQPVPRVLRRFAVGPHRWSRGHRGVDLTAAAGQPVLAAGPGVVAFAGRVAGVGVVVLDHDGGLRTTYQPVVASVRVDHPVLAGTPVGRLGVWSGHCRQPCLHWGALRGDTYLDPLVLLGLAQPVLLPLAGPAWLNRSAQPVGSTGQLNRSAQPVSSTGRPNRSAQPVGPTSRLASSAHLGELGTQLEDGFGVHLADP
jgi:murein DD-endopeptidase MepM/ murein hydrolase activator NlpD